MSAQDETTAAEHAALLATLTPEELAAMNDTDPEEEAALARIASGAADEDDDGDDEEEAPAAAPAPAAKETAPTAETPPSEKPEGEAPPAAAAEPERRSNAFRAELPADFADQQAALKASADALRQQFKDGDIDVDEYEAQRETLTDQRSKLDALALKADIAKDMETQSAEALWKAAIDRQFVAAASAEGGGIDYKTDKAKVADLDLFVKTLANNPANGDKDSDWFMREAHKRVLALHDIKPTGAPANADPAKLAAANAARKPPTDALPRGLANVPGADNATDMAGEFDHIDRLDGVELEAALSKLSADQRSKYLAGA
jgi:hypothetical protein